MQRVTLLTKEIETCRMEMIRLAHIHTFSSPEVVQVSVKLDHLLNEYQELNVKNSNPPLRRQVTVNI